MTTKQNRFISLFATADEFAAITRIMVHHDRKTVSDAVRFLITKEDRAIAKKEKRAARTSAQ